MKRFRQRPRITQPEPKPVENICCSSYKHPYDPQHSKGWVRPVLIDGEAWHTMVWLTAENSWKLGEGN